MMTNWYYASRWVVAAAFAGWRLGVLGLGLHNRFRRSWLWNLRGAKGVQSVTSLEARRNAFSDEKLECLSLN